jgi:hypothetical protein
MILFYNKKTGEVFATIDGRVHDKKQMECIIDNGIGKENIGKYIIGWEETNEVEEYEEKVEQMIELKNGLFKKEKVTEKRRGLTIEQVSELGEGTSQNIRSHVKGMLQNPDVLANAYYLSGGNPERNITDPNKIKQAEDYLVSKYEKSYEKDIKIRVDNE